MFFLKRNLPNWERAVRIVAGALIAAAVLSGFTAGIVSWAALTIAGTLALTAFVGFCPACAMAGRRYLDKQR